MELLKHKQVIIFFKLSLVVALVAIEYLATTTLEIKAIENTWDKANHFIAFFVLYILLSGAFTQLKIITKSIGLVLFGFHIEVLQYFIPNRDFSLLDVFADSIGILIGIAIYKLFTIVFLRK